jgi:hypothetical protein
MRPRQEYKVTTNLSVFNKLHKHILEKDGKIKCSHCPYHKSENKTNNFYGAHVGLYNKKKWAKTKYPNWKLVSKSPKQWMNKPTKVITTVTRWGNIYKIKW